MPSSPHPDWDTLNSQLDVYTRQWTGAHLHGPVKADDWGHFLVSEINLVHYLVTETARCLASFPARAVFIKHGLTDSVFEIVRLALNEHGLEGLQGVYDWRENND